MKTSIGALALSVAMVFPFAASAQEFSGAVTLGYSHTKQSDLDVSLNGLSLDGRLSYNIGNGVSFGTRYNSFGLDVAGQPINLNGSLIGLDVTYEISPAFSATAFIEYGEIGAEMGPFKASGLVSSKTFGLEANYSTGAVELGGFVATSTPGGIIGLGVPGLDSNHYGVSANYAPSDKLVVGGSMMRTTFGLPGGPDIDLDYIGIAGVYSVTGSVNIFGGLSSTRQGDIGIDVNTIAIGGSYDLSSTAGMPLLASLELARTTLDAGGGFDADVDSIRLGLTIPLGGASVKAPLNSTADAILNPAHTVISQTLLNF